MGGSVLRKAILKLVFQNSANENVDWVVLGFSLLSQTTFPRKYVSGISLCWKHGISGVVQAPQPDLGHNEPF